MATSIPKRHLRSALSTASTIALTTVGLVWGTFSCREQVNEDAMAPGAHRGKVLFEHHCAACHGIDGRGKAAPSPEGDTIAPRDLTSTEFQAAHTDDQLATAITQGVPPGMPHFDVVLSPDQLRDVVAHIRSLAGKGEPSPAASL